MPLWLKFDQLRSAKDLQTNDYDGFKRLKVNMFHLRFFSIKFNFNNNLKDYKQTDSSLSFSFDFDKDKVKLIFIVCIKF